MNKQLCDKTLRGQNRNDVLESAVGYAGKLINTIKF